MSQRSSTEPGRPSVRKVALASSIGAAIEWYDFFIYGTAAGLVFNKLFFANLDPATGTIVSFATFAVGFLARPFGAVVFGHFGDRISRKNMLIATLLIMGIATAIIGLLPTYESAGVIAPILLVVVRVVQGIGVGGEYGGAVLMAVEYAPQGRRGYFGSWPQAGVPAGLLMASGAFALLSLLPEEDFLNWGWRIAFVASLALVAVGLYIRIQVLETPAFSEIRAKQEEVKVPFVSMLKTQPKEFLLGMGTRWIEGLTFNAFGVLVVSYIANDLGLPQSVALNGVVIASAVGIVLIPVYGLLSDKFGRKPVYNIGVIFTALFAFPAFLLIETGVTGLIWLGIVLALGVFYMAIYAPLAAFWAELFDTRVRYTGVGSVYQFSGIIASGLTPLIGSVLIAANDGRPWFFVIYMVVVAAISMTCAAFLPETYKRDIMPTGSAPHATMPETTGTQR